MTAPNAEVSLTKFVQAKIEKEKSREQNVTQCNGVKVALQGVAGSEYNSLAIRKALILGFSPMGARTYMSSF